MFFFAFLASGYGGLKSIAARMLLSEIRERPTERKDGLPTISPVGAPDSAKLHPGCACYYLIL